MMIKLNFNLLKIIIFIDFCFAYNTEQHTYISSYMSSLIIRKEKKKKQK